MKLLNVIKCVANEDPAITVLKVSGYGTDHHVEAARKFLFGEKCDDNNPPVTAEAAALISKLGLTGSNFQFLSNGANGTVYCNKEIVFKLSSMCDDDDDTHYAPAAGGPEVKTNYLPVEEIPDGLAAPLISTGTCNGINFLVAERLNTERAPTLQDIIPFVYKAKDMGVYYFDIKPKNMGFDKEGNVRVLDHEHFEAYLPGQFADRVSTDVLVSYSGAPVVITDENYTYAALSAKGNDKECVQKSKKIVTSLKMLGVSDTEIDMDGAPHIIRIKRKEITYGTPEQTETMEKFLSRALQADVTQEEKATSFLVELTEQLGKMGQAGKKIIPLLPRADKLSLAKKEDFMATYNALTQMLEKGGAKEHEIEAVDKICDDYAKAQYPAAAVKPLPRQIAAHLRKSAQTGL